MSRSTTFSTDEIEAIEWFVADTQFRLHQLLEAKNVSRADLAKRLGMSRSRVSAMFKASSNLTLETVAKVLAVLGETDAKLSSPAIEARLCDLARQNMQDEIRGAGHPFIRLVSAQGSPTARWSSGSVEGDMADPSALIDEAA